MSGAALVTLLIGVAGLLLTARLVVREPDRRIRVAAPAGAVGGFLLAFLVTLALGKGMGAAIAVGVLGGAILPLALIGQWRLLRGLFARAGQRL